MLNAQLAFAFAGRFFGPVQRAFDIERGFEKRKMTASADIDTPVHLLFFIINTAVQIHIARGRR